MAFIFAAGTGIRNSSLQPLGAFARMKEALAGISGKVTAPRRGDADRRRCLAHPSTHQEPSPMLRRFPLALCLWLTAGLPLGAQTKEAFVVFKDGFSVRGKIVQQKKVEFDLGVAFTVNSGTPTIDDDVRRIYFVPGQIEKVIKIETGELDRDQMVMTKNMITPRKSTSLSAWYFDALPPFDKNWEREVTLGIGNSKYKMHQRIVMLTPKHVWIQSLTHNWDMHFKTRELNVDAAIKLVADYYDTKKELKELSTIEKRFGIAKFLYQAGWLENAEKELKDILEKAQLETEKKKVNELNDLIDREKAKNFAEVLEQVAEAKQHRLVQEGIKLYDKEQLAPKVPTKFQLLIQDLKNRYEADNEKLEKATVLFKDLMARGPQPRGFWLTCLEAIRGELNLDTLPRIETFVTFAEQFKREADQGKTPTQKLEDVLALAVTGWHLGNSAAEPDVKLAEKLWKSREFLTKYMKNDSPKLRASLAEGWTKEIGLPIEVVARLLQHLPPPNAMEKLPKGPFDLDLDLPDGASGKYHILLPPDYHHMRPYPVMMLLHGRENPEDLLGRWAALAARCGFILMAPRWMKVNDKQQYGFTEREQHFFMNCLRDLKRRFQVDSDRVFAFGWDVGASIAWDVGLAHPHQFAGILPMCGMPAVISQKYSANAQYLPFYIVDGDRAGNGPVLVRSMFTDWVRGNYDAFYFEYKGRGNEVFLLEFEPMMRWMRSHHRKYPNRALGNYNTGGGNGDEFKTVRHSDNRFYWLETNEIDDSHIQEIAAWQNNRSVAKMHASIIVANQAGAKGAANIFTQISIRSFGIKQATIWLSPEMIDFTKPIQLRINGRLVGNTRTVAPSIPIMLEEYFQNVDRQRLFYAKIDTKI
jgi:hypothetical protein